MDVKIHTKSMYVQPYNCLTQYQCIDLSKEVKKTREKLILSISRGVTVTKSAFFILDFETATAKISGIPVQQTDGC